MAGQGKAERRDRAMERARFVRARRGDPDPVAPAMAAMLGAELHAEDADDGPEPKAFQTGNVNRWVPIGPSVVHRGQAIGSPRVTGRIRDLAVSPNGRRAYAASAMGGVWYTDDGAHTWRPLGGWAEVAPDRGANANSQVCGCLLVDFDAGDDPARDFVIVGTGETTPVADFAHPQLGGVGVLAARGPATRDIGASVWEAETGRRLMEGLGIYRIARRPGRVAGSDAAATRDQLMVATSEGLFFGERRAPGEYQWVMNVGVDALVENPPPAPARTPAVTDILWLDGPGEGLIVVTIFRRGLAVSRDSGDTFHYVPGAFRLGGRRVEGRSSIAMVPGTNRLYMLTGLPKVPGSAATQPTDPALLRVADITVQPSAAAPAVRVNGVPSRLWADQMNYDQAIAVEHVGGRDRIYLGGQAFDPPGQPFPTPASLWCFQVAPTGMQLAPVPAVSRAGAPPAGEGAARDGLIGAGVHADVHVIRLGPAAPERPVWVGCDGGVFTSPAGGRVSSFVSSSNGMATLQPEFVANHPTSSYFVASGFQDNGVEGRIGDTVWEQLRLGDGGGCVIPPTAPHYVVGQQHSASWVSSPEAGFVGPTSRFLGGDINGDDREFRFTSSFYSGASAITRPPPEGAPPGTASTTRVALGTSRVWLTDDLGTANPNTWRVLPWPNGAPVDARPGGNDPVNLRLFGVPQGAVIGAPQAHGLSNAGAIRTLRWVSPTELLVLFDQAVIRWRETAPNTWQTDVVLSFATLIAAIQNTEVVLTDLFPIPGTQDFLLTTTGHRFITGADTCYLVQGGVMHRTRLREVMPVTVGGATHHILDPAYAVTLDPASPGTVYVGTVTGVWCGTRPAAPGGSYRWEPFTNGLPQAAVQDLSFWHNPAAPAGPRLLRAAVQARGLWEVDVSVPSEPSRTYLRAHAADDRRRFPTPLPNPRAPIGAPDLTVFASPDIVVRPRADPAAAPAWYGGADLDQNTLAHYQLWTFQTAMRWRYPAVMPTGAWTPQFGAFVEAERLAAGLPPGRFVDQPLWDRVVGSRIDPVTGAVSIDPAHPRAVYQPAWVGAGRMTAAATEIDLLECVRPAGTLADVWQVYAEPSTVEVLLHHRDSRPLDPTRAVAPDRAHALLLWRSAGTAGALRTLPIGDLFSRLLTMMGSDSPATAPADWHVLRAAGGGVRHTLTVPLDARMPRAVSVDVDLTPVSAGHHVLFLAVAASSADMLAAAPVAPPPATLADLVRKWPYAALRLVSCSPR